MNENHDFILFDSQMDCVDLMTDEQAGQLLKAMYHHNRGHEISFTDPMVQMAFIMFWQAVENSRAKRAKLRENGSKGGNAKRDNQQTPGNDVANSGKPVANSGNDVASGGNGIAEPGHIDIDMGISLGMVKDEDGISQKGKSPQRIPRAKFVPPTVEEVQAYCDARCNGISAQRFCDYYASQGWKKNNGQPVKDWQACVRQWEERDRNEAQLPAVSQGAPHFSNYGQEVKYQQQQQAQALLAARDIFKQNPEDIPPEWR